PDALSSKKIVYLEPVTGASQYSTGNNITIRFEKPLNIKESDIPDCIAVTGSKSMLHEGTFMICEDMKKIIFQPDTPFQYDEKITVRIKGRLLKMTYPFQKEFSYSFTTSKNKIEWNSVKNLVDEASLINKSGYLNDVPPAFPQISVTVDNNPATGDIFMSNYHGGAYNSYLIITDVNGILYWNRFVGGDCVDFKKQPNGHLSYFHNTDFTHYELDSTYNTVHTYTCGNSYTTNEHEFRLLNNGHAYVMAYDPETVNMQDSISGGNPNATVIGLIIQEVDYNHNVYFQWRSWDHFSILDSWHQNLQAPSIDYVHGNAIEIDNDSNIIISSRHLDEITKIDRTNGHIIWRFGGKNNQFTFLGDTLKFTYQHAIRRIGNGNLTLFDNGNYHTPPFSRAVEYNMDTAGKTATVVWEYRHTPSIFSQAMGYAQRLANGNTLIGWGWANPSVSEVKPDGTVVFEMSLPQGIYSYRAYKFVWGGAPTAIDKNSHSVPSSFSLSQNYPNPFNPSTKIAFSIPLSRGVPEGRGVLTSLTIYDLLGRSVATLVNENLQPGYHEVEWNASNFSSGTYFYKLTAGDFTDVKKMVLVK
ncbi:MAG: aryl-sulfate sulfotransferase, partial [Ignavibacteria bacterium]